MINDQKSGLATMALAVCVERLGGYVKITQEEAANAPQVHSRMSGDLLEVKTGDEEMGTA